MSRIVRRLRNPTVGFVGLSLGLHFGLLWLADIGFGRTLLTTPTAIVIVGVIAMQTAQFRPSIHERTGDFPRAAWLAVGVPLVLVAAGALLSIVLEGATISPATKSALFTPWWLLLPCTDTVEGGTHPDREDRERPNIGPSIAMGRSHDPHTVVGGRGDSGVLNPTHVLSS